MKKEILPQYEHTKFGKFMFKLCAKGTTFLVKHRGLYYLLSFTGGLIGTIIGYIILLVLAIAKLFNKNIKFKKYLGVTSVYAGPDYGGGFDMGLMFVRDQKSGISVDSHEFGHSFQGCLFGPFMFFIVSIPSAIRGWYQGFRERKGKENKAYDAMWFEDSASQCGAYAKNYIEENR